MRLKGLASIWVVGLGMSFAAFPIGNAGAQDAPVEPQAGEPVAEAPLDGDVAEPETGEPKAQVEQNADDLLEDIAKEFAAAIEALDKTTDSLDRAVELKDYEAALETVDALLGKVNALADRVRPGNATEVRAEQIIKDIENLIEEIRANDGLSPEYKGDRVAKLGAIKGRLEKGERDLSGFSPQLQELAEELNRKKRQVAYDVIISAYAEAAAGLENTNDRMRELIGKLRDYLDQIKEPLTQ